MNDMNFTTEEQLSPFQMYFNRLRGVFSGPLFLALTIVFTCLAALQFLGIITALESVPLMEMVVLAMSVLSTVGCWLVWSKARANTDFGKSMGLMRVYSTYELVIAYIGAVVFGLGMIVFAVFANQLNEAVRLAIEVETEAGAAEVMEMLRFYEEMGSFFGIILAIVCAVCCGVMVLMIIRQTKLVGMIKAVSFSFATGRVPRIKTGFYTVSTYVFLVFEGIGLIGSLFNSSPLAIMQMACDMALIILTLILITQVKADIKKYEAMEKSNVWF